MIEPMVLEFKIDDRFIDHPLLSKKELLKYDIDYCYKKVEEEVDKFISAQINYPFINAPTITCNYEVRYECFVPKKIDKVGNYVILKITKEEEIMRLYSNIVTSLKFLSKNEFTFFLECLYYKHSGNEFIRKANSSRFLLDQIKGSCVVKMARALDCAKEI